MTDNSFAERYQTCVHDAAHVLVTLNCTELTLKPDAITTGMNSNQVAVAATTAVRPFIDSVEKHRDVVRVAIAGKAGEEKLEDLTRDSEIWVPANPVHWRDDLKMMGHHVELGGIQNELEDLFDQVDALVHTHWEFVIDLANEAIRTLPRPVTRQTVLQLAVKCGVLLNPQHP